MKTKRNFFKRLLSPTPVEWKRRAKTFSIMAASFTTAFGGVKALGIATPEYFDLFVGAMIFICLSVATYSQQHEIEQNPPVK